MLPHQTQDSSQHGAGDVSYSKVKITPVVKEEVATQVDEKVKEEVGTHKVKEIAQAAKEMQGNIADQCDEEEMAEEESEYMHVLRKVFPNCFRHSIL